MKQEELMLGDIVTFRDCLEEGNSIIPISIVEIRTYNKDVLAEIDGDTSCDLLDVDELVGIPITPEILEKNGFVYNDLPFVQAWEQFGLTLHRGGNGYQINCGLNVALVIDSVHELQHALRLCGIEKEIII